MLRNIVFDFGGVLIDWNPRYLYNAIFTDKAEMEHFLQDICSTEWNTRLDAGQPFADGVRELQALYPQYKEEIAIWDTRWIEMLGGPIEPTVQLLHDLQQQGLHTFGLTNWSEEKFALVYPKYDFLHTLEGIVVSGTEKIVKPDKRLYQILLDRYQLRADESVFIDDNPANVQAARELGFTAINFHTTEQVKEELQRYL